MNGSKRGVSEQVKTAITLFTGGGGADIALMAAGYTVVAGIEYDADIAAVANKNLGGHVRIMDILDANPSDFPACDLLHASPPCPNFSVAKADGEETAHDIAMAEKVAEFVKVLKPRKFSLENVRGYKQSKSFKIICDALRDSGYKYRVCIINAADMGVAQTRIRLFVIASLDGMPGKPQPTHQKAKDEQHGLFDSRLPNWIGWYEAIEDLLPTLPESKFADWQLKRLPQEMKSILVDSAGFNDELGKLPVMRDAIQPCGTILSNYKHRKLNAFIVTDQHSHNGESVGIRNSDAPMMVVDTRPAAKTRAFIVDCQAAGNADEFGERGVTIPNSDAPMFTVTASVNPTDSQKRPIRAFIADGQNARADRLTLRAESEPMQTVTDQSKAYSRAWLSSGRVVSMTPRALARFMSIPDWYELPTKNALACKIIGNAIPCLLYQRIVEGL